MSKQPVQVGATIVTLNAHVDTIDTQQAAIRQAINDLGDGWNMTDVGAMVDASVRDGDASDWQPRR